MALYEVHVDNWKQNPRPWEVFQLVLINYVFIGCLLCAQHCARSWEIPKYRMRLCLKVFTVQMETEHVHKQSETKTNTTTQFSTPLCTALYVSQESSREGSERTETVLGNSCILEKKCTRHGGIGSICPWRGFSDTVICFPGSTLCS